MRRLIRLIMMFVSLLLASGLCFSDEAMPKPAKASEGTPAFVSGGIGSDDPIELVKKDYNLHLVFATKGSGEYLADVKVSIHNAAGSRVLETLSPGPLFYVNLPFGNYRITAEFLGKPLYRSVTVDRARSRDLYFYWDQTGM